MRRAGDDGQSLIEAIVLGLALFVPVILGLTIAAGVHRTTLAAEAAAHAGARAWSTSPSPGEARSRALAAAKRAVTDYGFAADAVEVSVDGVFGPGQPVTVRAKLAVPRLARLVTIERVAAADADQLRASGEP